MGQFIGKAVYHSSSYPFLNLSLPALAALWDAFHDIADAFALSLSEFQHICSYIVEEQHDSVKEAGIQGEKMFELLDKDNNGLIDSLEFFCSIAIPSGLSFQHKLQFIFKCFDFEGNNSLTMDEVELAIRSTIYGISKLTRGNENLVKLKEEDYEGFVMDAFREERVKDNERITLEAFLHYCIDNIDCRRFLSHYDTPRLQLNMHPMHQSRTKKLSLLENQQSVKNDWMKDAELLIPSKFEKKNLPMQIPSSQMLLEWIHGYSDICVNNVRYTNQGMICYHAANVGIVYNKKNNQQRFFNEHSSQITSFSLHPDGTKVATGEDGDLPSIIVWDVETLSSLHIMSGFYSSGISHLSFSNTGSKLVSIGKGKNDKKYIVIYDWVTSTRLYSSILLDSSIIDLSFSEEEVVATCGVDHITFWTKEGRCYTIKPGIFGKKKKETQKCVEFMKTKDDICLSGSISGNINVWKGRNCVKAIKAHDGSLDVMNISHRAIITGGEDLKVRIWTLSLRKGIVLNIRSLTRLPGSIQSICLSADGARILLGMNVGEIFEISSSDGSDINGGALVTGHTGNNLLDISTHPMKEVYCTVGDDQTVRVWDISAKSMIKYKYIDDGPIQSVAYSPDGESIAIGVDDDNNLKYNQRKEGTFLLLQENDLTIIRTVKTKGQKHGVLGVRFSMNGERLILHNRNGDIIVYDTTSDYKDFIFKVETNLPPLKDIDLSEDGCWVQAMRSNGDIIFANFTNDNASLVSNFSVVRDIDWSTRTCPSGWYSIAVWKGCGPKDTITACDLNESENVLVTGDNRGRIRLLRYPCGSDAYSQCYNCHSKSISKAKFANGDNNIVSIGLKDRCIFQWQHIEEEYDSGDEEMHYSEVEIEKRKNDDLFHNMAPGIMTSSCAPCSSKTCPYQDRNEDILSFAPHNPPTSSLRLQFIYGYNTKYCKSDVKYSCDGSIIYHQANVGIIFNKETNQQRFHLDHTDKCVSLAISSCRKYVATGSAGQYPRIFIWDSVTSETIGMIDGAHEDSVQKICFSYDGNLIASVGGGMNALLSVHRWRDSFLTNQVMLDIDEVIDIRFFPRAQNDMIFVLGSFCAVNVKLHSCPYFEFIRDGNIKKKQSFSSLTFFIKDGGMPIVGTSTGNLLLYDRTQLAAKCKGHDGVICSLETSAKGEVISGGSDGKIRIWQLLEGVLQCIHDWNICLNDVQGSLLTPLSLDLSNDHSTLLIGTKESQILEFSAADGEITNSSPVLRFHNRGNCQCVVSHPKKPHMATFGDDGILIWDWSNKKLIKFAPLDLKCTYACFTNDGRFIAVATSPVKNLSHTCKGIIILFHSDSMRKLYEFRDSKEEIRFMKFSPNAKILVVVYIDSNVSIFETKVAKYYKKSTVELAKVKGVLSMDFTEDSRFLKIVPNDANSQYIDIEYGKLIPAEVVSKSNLDWVSKSSKNIESLLSFDSSSDRNSPTYFGCDAQREGNNIVTLDVHGIVSLWFLSNQTYYGNCLQNFGHSESSNKENIASGNCVSWSNDDSTVFTVGMHDNCLFQWSHIVEKQEVKFAEPDNRMYRNNHDSSKALLENVTVEKPKLLSPNQHTRSPEKGEKDMMTNGLPAMQLTCVHGRQMSSKGLLSVYNPQGDIIYSVSHTGVIFNTSEHSQIFQEDHTGTIACMCLSHDKKNVVTADDQAILIWDSSTGNSIASIDLQNAHCLEFSPDDSYLACISGNKSQQVTIYRSLRKEWANPIKLSSMKWFNDDVIFSMFLGDRAFPLLIASPKSFSLIKLDGLTLNYTSNGIQELESDNFALVCGCLVSGVQYNSVVTGTDSGDLQQRQMRNSFDLSVLKSESAHDGGVTAVTSVEMWVVSGGNDGKLCLWDSELVKLRIYHLNDIANTKSFSSSIRSICCNKPFNKMVVSAKAGKIIEISKDSGKPCFFSTIRCLSETHGLAMHPKDCTLFATSDDDGLVCVWDIITNQILRRTKIECASRSISWNPEGNAVCVGMSNGPGSKIKECGFVILDSTTLEVLHKSYKIKKGITDIKYSPCGKKVGIASEDGSIYLFYAPSYKLKIITKKGSSPISNIDFDIDGNCIRAQFSEVLLYFSTINGSKLQEEAVLDKIWSTCTCSYGSHIKNLRNYFSKYESRQVDINVTSIHSIHGTSYAAYATSLGSIGLFSFASSGETFCIQKSQCKPNLTVKVSFNNDASFLVTLQKNPNTITIYRLIHTYDMEH